jgi:hypothetical protein
MLVAQRIVRDIVRGRLRPGDLLPPERAMLATYETGRGTLREALEFQGVIALKPGPRGGPVLLDPDASHLAGTVVLLMQLRNPPLRTIVEVRAAVEPVVAGLAAERMPADSLAELAGTVEQLRPAAPTRTRSSTPTGASMTSSPGPAATRCSATWSTRCSRSRPGSSRPGSSRPGSSRPGWRPRCWTRSCSGTRCSGKAARVEPFG